MPLKRKQNCVRLNPDLCPHCGAYLDAATDAEKVEALPTPGDICLCLQCAGICLWNEDMWLEKAPPDFLETLCPGHRSLVERAQELIRTVSRTAEKRKAQH